MSTTQNYDFNSGNISDEIKDQPLDSGEPGDGSGGPTQGGILGAASGAVAQATNAVKQGADAVVNAGKGIVEMGGSVISGLKRGFSKTGESGGE